MTQVIQRLYPSSSDKAKNDYYQLDGDKNEIIGIRKNDLLSLMPPDVPSATTTTNSENVVKTSTSWLTDSIVDGYLFLLTRDFDHFSYLDTTSVQYLMSELDEDIRVKHIITNGFPKTGGQTHYAVPINVNQDHWILATIRLDTKVYSILDPKQKQLDDKIASRIKYLTELLLLLNATTKKTENQQPPTNEQIMMMRTSEDEIVKQTDNYNCGVFVSWFAKQFASNGRLNEESFEADRFRIEIFDKITSSMTKVLY